MILAIDGPVASGKSLTARLIAERLGIVYFDTGMTYRAVGLAVIRQGIDPDDAPAVIRLTERLDLAIRRVDQTMRVILDGEDVTDALWASDVAAVTSQVSTIPPVRARIVEKQREAVRSLDAVVAGRDIGTVVFPDAVLKVYLDATADERARRRYEELRRKGVAVSYDDVYRSVLDRDKRDTQRAESPLVRADDAILIDTTDLTVDQQVDRVLEALTALMKKTGSP